MSDEAKKKIKEGKSTAKKAEKAAQKNKTAKQAQQISDAAKLKIAAELPAGGAKEFLLTDREIDELEAKRAAVSLAIRGKRAKLRELKIDLKVYDHVRKIKKMLPEDAKAFKATEAVYTEQLGLDTSPAQKQQLAMIAQKRTDAKEALATITPSGNTGKEMGSGTTGVSKSDPEALKEISGESENTSTLATQSAVPPKTDIAAAHRNAPGGFVAKTH